MSTANQQKKAGSQDAAGNTERSFNTYDGKVISVADNKLMMRNTEGVEVSHILAKDAKLTCDGAICTADDLKTGRRIRVTTTKSDRNVATSIESLDKNAEFESACS